MKKLWPIALLLLVGACAESATPEGAGLAVPTTPIVEQITILPSGIKASAMAATSTRTPTITPAVTPTSLPPTETSTTTAPPSETPSPMPTATPTPMFVTTPIAMPGSFLVVYGARDMPMPAYAQIDTQNYIYPLGGPSPLASVSWWCPHLSPDGQWLACEERGDQKDKLILYNLLTRETQTIWIPVGAFTVELVFDAASRRVAYTVSADPVHQINDLHAWAIYVRDLATETETLFGGPFSARSSGALQPGEPIAWLGDELLLDTFVYLGEDVSQGVWALNVNKVSPGETVLLQGYDRLVLSPQDVAPRAYRQPTMSSSGDMLAFLIYDHDYKPTCLDRSGAEPGSAVGLGIVPATGGEPRILVDITGQDRALAGPLTWSPDGQQILFAQGQCQDETSPFRLTLRTVDLQENITGEWPLAPLDSPWSKTALWCTRDDVVFQADREELWHLDLATGQSEPVLRSEWVGIVGCLP